MKEKNKLPLSKIVRAFLDSKNQPKKSIQKRSRMMPQIILRAILINQIKIKTKLSKALRQLPIFLHKRMH